MSVLIHVQNKRSWTTGDLFSKCEQPELNKETDKIKGMAFVELRCFHSHQSQLRQRKIIPI